MRRERPVTVLLVLLVLLAGCGGSAGGAEVSGGGGGADSATVAEANVEAERAADAGSGDGGGDGGDGGDASSYAQREGADATGRSIIRTGQVRLRVENFEAARANLTEAVESRGGYVSDSTQQVHDRGEESWTSGRVVLRVPAEDFTDAMNAVENEGRVLESSTSTRDVTEQVVDLQARLDNLRAERERLRELYQRANDTEDVLAVERRLSEVQTEIERTEARLQNLERQVAYSTITVEMSEPRPDRPAPDQWYDTPVLAAFLDSVHGVGVVLRAAVVGFAYALPYLFVFLGPFVVAGALLYRFRGRLLGRGDGD
jgi:cell division septum initiation protein DivIVA